MYIGLLLALLVAVLAFVAHRKRESTLERRFLSRVSAQLQELTAGRDEARRAADEADALDRVKSRVLVNVMNDLRTPLLMIKSPVQTTLRLAGSAELDDNELERMMHHANRLQRGLEQVQRVLELELGGTNLDFQPRNVVEAVERFATSLRPLAERHGVTVEFASDLPALTFSVDWTRLEQILECFIERAFTDLSSGGTFSIHLTRKLANGQDDVVLELIDDGRPIDERYVELLRSEGETIDEAIHDVTGLGLALSRRHVLLHGGELEIERPGRGTLVRIVLPVRTMTSSGSGDEIPEPASELSSLIGREEHAKPERPVAADDVKETTILVVDDHAGTRGYLAFALREYHNVIEATNGEEALRLVRERDPDLVVSDVMMPIMDGNQLCRAIKGDEKLNHIPIFLVTANAVPSVKREGLESGADDYLIKPFDLEEAIMRINNELNARTRMRRRYRREVIIKPSDVVVTSADEAFLNRAREIIEEHMDDGNFGVQELASELGLSPRQLQRRLRETVDQSPVEFIRTLRLQRAAQLLEGQYGNVSEVAYSVGFTSLSYFAKCFRDQFGMAPSEFKAEQAA